MEIGDVMASQLWECGIPGGRFPRNIMSYIKIDCLPCSFKELF